jgi:hypothetical protein
MLDLKHCTPANFSKTMDFTHIHGANAQGDELCSFTGGYDLTAWSSDG